MSPPGAPDYVHRILDSYLTGQLLDFDGLQVPADVRLRLAGIIDPAEFPAAGLGDLPPRGWVRPGEVVHCDACGDRCHVWQLHHLWPMDWGGPTSRALVDHQKVWVRVDGRCHDTIHMILEQALKEHAWPELWINQHGGIPHLVVQTAKRGWALHLANAA